MLKSSAIGSMLDIEQKVLSEVAVATLDFICPHCGRVLRIALDQIHIPKEFPCGKPFELILSGTN